VLEATGKHLASASSAPKHPPLLAKKTCSLDCSSSSSWGTVNNKVPLRMGPAPFSKVASQGDLYPVKKQFSPSSTFTSKGSYPKVVVDKLSHVEQVHGGKGVQFKNKLGKMVSLSFDEDAEIKSNSQEANASCLKPSLTSSSTEQKEYQNFLSQMGKILSSKAEFL